MQKKTISSSYIRLLKVGTRERGILGNSITENRVGTAILSQRVIRLREGGWGGRERRSDLRDMAFDFGAGEILGEVSESLSEGRGISDHRLSGAGA